MALILAVHRAKDGNGPEHADLAKAFVMAAVARIVAVGRATIVTLDSGELELRLATGEILLLGNETVTRLA
jgi:hypothetical protein